MDIKAQVTQVVEKVKTDKELQDLFKKDPVKAVEKVIGVDLPDDAIKGIVDGVKAKMTVDNIGDILGKLGGKK